jgi:DNA-damage-inducible protein D
VEKETIIKLNKSFEESAYEQDGIEYWLARELQILLGYSDWRNFINAIEKAKESCKTTGEAVLDHFVDVTKMVKIGSGAERKQDDIMLTRYACYLIAQNGDPKNKATLQFKLESRSYLKREFV